MKNGIDEQILEQRLGVLEAARAWSPRVISRLEAMIRTSDDKALFRINPLSFAAERGMTETEAIDLFLHATAAGLFEMDWGLLCPMCACVVESFESLRGVGDCYHCPMCRGDYTSTLDEYIAVSFTVAAAVRTIAFHHPEQMTADDYCFVCRMTAEGRLPDGSPLVDFIRAATHGVSFLPAGATTRFTAASTEGVYFGWDVDSGAYFEFPIEGAPAAAPQVVPVRYGDHACEPAARTVAPGDIVFEIENATSRRGIFAICTIPPGVHRHNLRFVPFLTGGRLLATQTFRELFRSELVKATEGIAVRDVTLIFTDLKGSTALYERIGDLNAFSLVQQHFERLLDVTVRHGGAVIKTLGDAVMAAFLTPEDAIKAAIAMRHEIGQFNEVRPGHDLVLKIGLHHGPSIAVTLNERLDYFGQTVNIAARVQGLAQGDEICLTDELHDAPGVQAALAAYPVERIQAQLKGVNQTVAIFRVARGEEKRV